jgi:cell division protein FtsW (lipid II flippase)
MAAGDAPRHYLFVNGMAQAVGLMLAAMLAFVPPRWSEWLAHAAAMALLATALLGVDVDGIRRWVSLLGVLQIQPAFILLPLLLCYYARRKASRAHSAAVMIAALAIAAMPDRSMAMALFMVSFAVWLADRTHAAALVLAAATLALGVTLWRADPLTGLRHVEYVLAHGWQSGPLTGAVLNLGALAMLAPLLTARHAAMEQQRAIIAFSLCWATLLIASVVAPFPTPLLGYGASAIIGYMVSASALRRSDDTPLPPAVAPR